MAGPKKPAQTWGQSQRQLREIAETGNIAPVKSHPLNVPAPVKRTAVKLQQGLGSESQRVQAAADAALAARRREMDRIAKGKR